MRAHVGKRIRLAMLTALTALTLDVAVGPTAAARSASSEDPLSLVALLIQDGNLNRAEAVLDRISPAVDGDLDTGRYWTLQGLVSLRQGDPAQAADALTRALDLVEGGPDPQLVLSLARARVLSGDQRAALEALARGGEILDAFPSAYLIAARAHRDLSEPGQAWTWLERGAERFPHQVDFVRQQVLLLVEMGLSQEAGLRAHALLGRPDGTADDALTVAEAFRSNGDHARAASVLEEARLRFGGDDRLQVRLASVYAGADQPLAAARLLQVASGADPDLADEAAELFRRAGKLDAALMMNGQVADPVEKARQRFGLLLDGQDFARAVALQPRLSRLGLLDDDAVRYGLAYGWFRLEDFDRCEDLLAGISDPRIFRQATELRRAIQAAHGTEG